MRIIAASLLGSVLNETVQSSVANPDPTFQDRIRNTGPKDTTAHHQSQMEPKHISVCEYTKKLPYIECQSGSIYA